MKSTTMILVGAGAIATALVFLPKAARAAASQASGPRVGRGDGATVWNANAQKTFREQLARELSNAGEFWI